MYIKSFFANTVEEALLQARRELGDDALLLNSHLNSKKESGLYEVTIGTTNNYSGQTAEENEPPSLPEYLMEKGFPPNFAYQISKQLSHSIVTESDLRNLIQEKIELSTPDITPETVLALIGPPGHGKTLTLIKLAIQSMIHSGLAPLIVSGTTSKAGASHRLQTITEIANLSFVSLDCLEQLPEILRANRGQRPVLVDTPGFSVSEQSLLSRWASVLGRAGFIQNQLVLSATSQFHDLRAITDRYQVFHFRHMIFTHLDEAFSTGSLLSLAMHTQAPVSWLGIGQSECGDLEKASHSLLLDPLFEVPQASVCALAAGAIR